MFKMEKNKPKTKLVIILILLVVAFVLMILLSFVIVVDNIMGNVVQIYETASPSVAAEPYLNEIVFEDANLRRKSVSIVSECESGNKECQVNEIYKHVVKNYNYYSDPRKEEFIQSPYETIDIGGGDCEDLTILLNSLLENIGIRTYLVLTENHAYSLACGIDINDLQKEIMSSLDEEEIADEIISLEANTAKYYGWEGEEVKIPVEIVYSIDSDEPIDVHVVPSSESLELWSEGESYIYYPSCSGNNLYRSSGSCKMDRLGGILIINENIDSAVVNVNIKIKYSTINLENFSTKYYTINSEQCIILDPSAGQYSYPGYESNTQGEKRAIDPLTKEYIILN